MDNVVFSRADQTVTGLNRPAGPAEYSLTLPYPVTVTKLLPWNNGEKQKTNADGQLLYYSKPVLQEDGSETVNEVTTARIATAWEEVTQEYTLVTEDGPVPMSSTARVATEWDELEPVLVPNVEQYQVSFAEQPSLFLYPELRAAKLASMERIFKPLRLVYFDEDFDPARFSTELADHAANMGDGVIALHPGGKCRTVKLQLSAAGQPPNLSKEFQTIRLYLEAQEGVKVEIGATASGMLPVADGVVELPEAADAVYVCFCNMTDSYKEVYAFGLLA